MNPKVLSPKGGENENKKIFFNTLSTLFCHVHYISFTEKISYNCGISQLGKHIE